MRFSQRADWKTELKRTKSHGWHRELQSEKADSSQRCHGEQQLQMCGLFLDCKSCRWHYEQRFRHYWKEADFESANRLLGPKINVWRRGGILARLASASVPRVHCSLGSLLCWKQDYATTLNSFMQFYIHFFEMPATPCFQPLRTGDIRWVAKYGRRVYPCGVVLRGYQGQPHTGLSHEEMCDFSTLLLGRSVKYSSHSSRGLLRLQNQISVKTSNLIDVNRFKSFF